MFKILAMLAVLLFPPLVIGGCWSAREIDQLAFVAAMGIDKDENGVKLTVQIIVGGSGGDDSGGGGSSSPVWVTSVTGNSLSEAVFNLSRKVSKIPFLSHTYLVVLGEDFAREGIDQLIDWLSRERQMRDRVRLAVARGTAEDILMIEPKMTQLPAEYLEEVLRFGVDTGFVPRSQLLDVRIAYANQPRMQVWLPLLQAEQAGESGGGSGGENPAEGTEEGAGDKPEAVELGGSAVFRGDRLVGFLNLYETRGIAWLTGHVSETLISLSRQEGQITQRVQFARVSYETTQENGIAVLKALISQDGTLEAWPLREDGITPTLLTQLGDDLGQTMEGEIRAALYKLQNDYNADCAGLGERLRRLDKAQFEAVNWDEAFSKLTLELDIEASFRRIGLTK